MATEVKMPKLGIDMIEGSISRWLKNEGDSVKKEEPIAEVETDKSTVEMTAPADGVLVRIAVQPEELVPVGAVLAYIGEQGESLSDVEEQAPPAASANGEREAEPATGEAGETLTSEDSQQAAEGDSAKPSAAQKVEAAPTPQAAPSGTGTGAAPAATAASGEVRASPVARRLAQERGFNLTDIKGTGPGGRIVARDVEGFQTSAPAAAPAQAPAQPAAPEAAPARTAAAPAPAASGYAPQVTGIGAAEEIPLTRMRRRISEVMTASKGPVPHFYVTMEVDMEAAMELRQQMNTTLKEEGVKISVNDLVVKAAALALKKFPNINSSFAGDKIVRHGDINVGIAVSTENGLLTIVTRNTDRMALSELSQVTRERADRARAGKLHPDDFGGSTFTVSNLGMYGVESFVAVITPPEAAILAVGGIQKEPVVKDGQVVIGQRMHATISADHRVTDGVEAAEYMVEFKRLLENPMRLML